MTCGYPPNCAEEIVAVNVERIPATRDLVIGKNFQDRRQPGHQDVTASRPTRHRLSAGSQPAPPGVKSTSPDTENHAKVYDDNNIFMTNVDNDNSDTTYTNMRNM